MKIHGAMQFDGGFMFTLEDAGRKQHVVIDRSALRNQHIPPQYLLEVVARQLGAAMVDIAKAPVRN